MEKFDKNELLDLKSFRERVLYLFEKTWKGTRRKFCDECKVGRTTFYHMWKGKKENYSDYLIDKYARVFNVSFDFMKYGGDEPGYYFSSYERLSRVCEKEPVYGTYHRRGRKSHIIRLDKAAVILTTDDAEEILEVLMKIRYKDIDF